MAQLTDRNPRALRRALPGCLTQRRGWRESVRPSVSSPRLQLRLRGRGGSTERRPALLSEYCTWNMSCKSG